MLQIQEWFIKLAIGYIPLPLYTPSKPKQYIFHHNWIFFYDWKNCKNNALLIAKHRFKKVPILPRTAIEFISRYPRTLTIFSYVPTLSSSTTCMQFIYIQVYLEPWQYSHPSQPWNLQPPKCSLYPDILEPWQYSHSFQPWAFQPPEYN